LVHEILRVLGVGAAIVLLVAAITALVFFLSGQSTGLKVLTNLVGIALIVAFGAIVATLGQAIRQGLSSGRAQARAARLHQKGEKLAALAATHPDVALVLELLQEQAEEQQIEAGRRAFWQGVAQNFVFYLLGIIVPIVLLGLHAGG
jgi:hypothetical protein